MNALRSSAVEVAISGAINIVTPFAAAPAAASLLSANKRRAELFVDFPDFLYAVYIRLINAFCPAAAAIVTPGTEFTVYSASAPQRLVDDPDPFFSCSIFDQYGAHFL